MFYCICVFLDVDLGSGGAGGFGLDPLSFNLSRDLPISFMSGHHHDGSGSSLLDPDVSDKDSTNPTPVSSPSHSSSIFFPTALPPEELFNSDTQMSLVERSSDLRLDDTGWPSMMSSDEGDIEESSRKALKSNANDDAYSTMNKDTFDDTYEPHANTTSTQFFLSGQNVTGFSLGLSNTGTNDTRTSNVISR